MNYYEHDFTHTFLMNFDELALKYKHCIEIRVHEFMNLYEQI